MLFINILVGRGLGKDQIEHSFQCGNVPLPESYRLKKKVSKKSDKDINNGIFHLRQMHLIKLGALSHGKLTSND